MRSFAANSIRVHWRSFVVNFSGRLAIGSKFRFVKKYFETIPTLGGPVRLFQITPPDQCSKKHVRGFTVRTAFVPD
jgi:hypothetical protein